MVGNKAEYIVMVFDISNSKISLQQTDLLNYRTDL